MPNDFMHAGDPHSLPNPFAVELNSTRRAGRRAVVSALKFLVVVAVAFAIVLVVGSQSRRWLLRQLTGDFDSLNQPQKQQRLVQIAQCGAPAIPFLARTLADSDSDVARAAYDLLRESQNDWTLLDRDELIRRHEAMVQAIGGVAVDLPPERGGWTASLLQQTILEAVEAPDAASRHLHSRASDLLAELSLQGGASDSALPGEGGGAPGSESQQIAGSSVPVRVSARSEPLPVAADSMDRWTHWPPGQEDTARPTTSPSAARAEGSRGERTSSAKPGQPEEARHGSTGRDGSASIYRSSSTSAPAVRLRPLTAGEPVTLRAIDAVPSGEEEGWGQRSEAAAAASDSALQPAAHLVDSPLETLDTRSVIYWLGGTDVSLQEQARRELRRRGFDEHELRIATLLASGDLAARLQLVESLAHSDRVDPRPWLLMLLRDRSRDVKLRALSVLATMRDAAINQQLRARLASERDPTVAARIRSVLELR